MLLPKYGKLVYGRTTNTKEVKQVKHADPTLQVKFNQRVFMKFYPGLRRRFASERKMAEAAGVSHTLVQQLRTGKDSAGRPKKYVNLCTAQQMETAWDIPPSLVFMPELVDGRSTAA